MRMLRFSLGKTRLDRVQNEEVRKRMKVSPLGDKIREARLRWYGHVIRREEEYVGKRVQRMNIGKRKRGRPRRRIEECYRDDMKALGLQDSDARDRNGWRGRIRTVDPTP